MSLKDKKEKKKARLVSARRMADAVTGKVSKAYQLPHGKNVMKIESDKSYTFDVVCYKAGKGNPDCDEGFDAAGRRYSAHNNVGPNRDRYCCPAGTFDKPCCICTARSERIRSTPGIDFKNDELLKAWNSSKRSLFNVWDHDDKKAGCKLLDISDYAFSQMLVKTTNENEDKYEYWASPGTEGFTIKASFEKKKIGSGDFPNCWKIELLPRREPIPDEVLDSAMCLDDMLICPENDKLRLAFDQGSTDSGDDPKDVRGAAERANQPSPPKKEEPKAGPEWEAGMWVEYDDKVREVIKVHADGTLDLEDMKGKIVREVDAGDCVKTTKPKEAAAVADNGKETITVLSSRKKKPAKKEEEE